MLFVLQQVFIQFPDGYSMHFQDFQGLDQDVFEILHSTNNIYTYFNYQTNATDRQKHPNFSTIKLLLQIQTSQFHISHKKWLVKANK